MRLKEITKAMNLSNDLINIFTDYAFCLDDYFKSDINKKEHKDLYIEYLNLNKNLKEVLRKNGFDK